METDLRGDDPGQWGHSLANLGELLLPILDAAGARSVVEIGAYAGIMSAVLLEWGERSGASVIAVDPAPEPELVALAQRPGLELIEATSEEALSRLDLPDAVVIDGDHNYYAVQRDLALIAERAAGGPLPLLLLHDLCWPHARRDAYYAPERIPAEHRQPMTEGGGLAPGEEGIVPGGLPFAWAATQEGGPGNGVLTALEDFLADREGLRFALVPAFFGLGVVWEAEAPWSGAVAELVEPWDRNPIVARLEANRVFLLAARHRAASELGRLESQLARTRNLLEGLEQSRSVRVADRLRGLRNRGRGPSLREQVRQALEEGVRRA